MADIAQLEQALIKADQAGNTDDARALAAEIRRMRAHPEQPQQAQQEPSFIDNLGRQAGRTGRMLLEGAGDVAGIVGNPLAAMTGARRPADIASDLATRMGLPENVTNTERLTGAIGRGMVGAAGMVGAGGAISRAPGLVGEAGKLLAAQPVAQLASAAGGAGGSELARQGGAGPSGQLAAGLAGSIAPTVAAKLIPKIGGVAADVIGGLGTHTGGESLKQATKAGFEGGKRAGSFLGSMRGKTQMTDVLDDVKANIAEMGAKKSQAYRQGMAQVSKDSKVLQFDGIDKAMKNAYDMATFKGQVKNVKAAKSLQETYDAIARWKGLDPAEFHTPEGLDALKQNIGGILESIPFEEKTARSAVGQIYNSIKSEINKQAPVYAKVMKDYSDSTDVIKEIERALSIGQKASADAGMRKLQSLMRNNASTNYGNRLALAKQMEEAGGREIMPALAGQALNTVTPRGLGSAVAGGLGLGGYVVGGPALAIPTLAAQSPRLMGEAAYYTGKLSGLAKPLAPAAYGDMSEATLRSLLYGGMGANQ